MKSNLTNREIQAQQTEKKVFESAIRLIQEKGYEHVTIDDIAKDAHVSKGTFYTYFETKDAVVARQFKLADEAIIEMSKNTPNESLDKQLLSFLTQAWNCFEHFCGLNIMKTIYKNEISSDLRSTLLMNENRAFYNVILDFIRKGREEQIFRNDISEKEMSTIIIHSARGLICDWCFCDGSFDLVSEGTAYFNHIIEIILKK